MSQMVSPKNWFSIHQYQLYSWLAINGTSPKRPRLSLSRDWTGLRSRSGAMGGAEGITESRTCSRQHGTQTLDSGSAQRRRLRGALFSPPRTLESNDRQE